MMRIAVAASECVPFALTGGLGEVVGALPQYLAQLGHKVTVYLPLYGSARQQLGRDGKTVIPSITIPFTHYKRFLSVVDGSSREDVAGRALRETMPWCMRIWRAEEGETGAARVSTRWVEFRRGVMCVSDRFLYARRADFLS